MRGNDFGKNDCSLRKSVLLDSQPLACKAKTVLANSLAFFIALSLFTMMKSDVATVSGLLEHVQVLLNDNRDLENGKPVEYFLPWM